MSDQMTPIPFNRLFDWILSEYINEKTIFGISQNHFYRAAQSSASSIFNEQLDTPLGPAAGPHTQLAQNIVSSYLPGGRFFELKTVQILDELKIDKPCIDAQDEGYNVEWSQELKLEQSFDEYLKAWFLLHVIKPLFELSHNPERGFVFNMSVGYNLEGIKTERMNRFIESLKNASSSDAYDQYKSETIRFLKTSNILHASFGKKEIDHTIASIETISPEISRSVTLSTMHGCPPEEIEAIAKYLLSEKKLHTYVKLNPTLLGYEKVNGILQQLGYRYITLDPASFEHDIHYKAAVPMLQRLQLFAHEHGRQFGVKLSNTLGVKNRRNVLAGDDMYMSGRSLFPLTISVAKMLAEQFSGKLQMSFSGGAATSNVDKILACGISPVTLVTDLLKPGGYGRLFQMANKLDGKKFPTGILDVENIKLLADSSLNDPFYRKEKREISSVKIPTKLELYDCYVAPCEKACPIHQDVAAYVHLVEEGKYNEAFEVIVEKNPLPFITSYICDHQCQAKCTRWDYDDPVKIREMKKVASHSGYQTYYEKIVSTVQDEKGKTAVIGAGPAGLACAYFLAKEGIDVTIFERSARAGGTVQNVIPDFRLPQTAIDADIEFIKKHGVKFQFGADEHFLVEKLKAQGFKYIFVGIGATKSTPIQLEKGNENVINAIEFLWHYNNKEESKIGKKVAVVGGGNSAMDAARAAKRIGGVEEVSIVYRRTKEFMPADKEELDAAMEDKVIFMELLLPVSHEDGKLKCQKMLLGDVSSDGRRSVTPIENAFVQLEVDTIISAIGESVDFDLLAHNNIAVDRRKNIVVDGASNETSLENVFIGGDAFRGPSTVVESMADGKKAAEAILKKENMFGEQNSIVPDDLLHVLNNVAVKKPIVQAVDRDATIEASRCLSCSFICNKCVDVCPNRANVAVKMDGSKDQFQILHIDGMCNDCGNCETFCPHIGAPYKDKLTLFWSEAEMMGSSNDGFLLTKQSGSESILLKKNNQISELHFGTDGKNAKVVKGEVSDFEIKFVVETLQNYRYLFL